MNEFPSNTMRVLEDMNCENNHEAYKYEFYVCYLKSNYKKNMFQSFRMDNDLKENDCYTARPYLF